MVRKIALWLLWVSFTGYAFFLAPPNQPETFDLIKRLATLQIEGINPLIVALFNIMGVFPIVHSCLLFIDGRMQKIRAYPFALASFGVGAFALLPYLALREPNPTFVGKKSLLLKILDSRWFGATIAIGAIGLVLYGVTQGNWSDFVQQWRTDRFIHVMSLDFCLLCLLFPLILPDDLARRGLTNRSWFWAVSLVPLLGAAVYLAVRPPLVESEAGSSAPNSEASPV
jgi:hypothetical protein